MKKEQTNDIIKLRILELEDKLMNVIEISRNYENVPVPVFEFEMDALLKEIEHLEIFFLNKKAH